MFTRHQKKVMAEYALNLEQEALARMHRAEDAVEEYQWQSFPDGGDREELSMLYARMREARDEYYAFAERREANRRRFFGVQLVAEARLEERRERMAHKLFIRADKARQEEEDHLAMAQSISELVKDALNGLNPYYEELSADQLKEEDLARKAQRENVRLMRLARRAERKAA